MWCFGLDSREPFFFSFGLKEGKQGFSFVVNDRLYKPDGSLQVYIL